MFGGVKNGWNLIKDSILVFNRHPKFLIPLLIVWLIYAPVVLYLEYGFNWDALSAGQIFLFIFGIIFLFDFLLAFSCSLLLELIQQLESGQKINLFKAFTHTLSRNIVKIVPVVIVWTIIWFVLLIVQALFSSREGRKKEPLTAENAAKTLAGWENFSLPQAIFEALEKGIRMIVFLIIPAIVWENFGFGKAVKKGLGVFRTHFSEFATGFTLTWLATAIIFIPPAILFYLSDEGGLTFPTWVWATTIVYISFAWSYSLYLEQMLAANLYLWHLKWEKQTEEERKLGKQLSNLRDVKRPSLLDGVPELLEK